MTQMMGKPIDATDYQNIKIFSFSEKEVILAERIYDGHYVVLENRGLIVFESSNIGLCRQFIRMEYGTPNQQDG